MSLHQPLVAVGSTFALSSGTCTGVSCSSRFFCTQLPGVSDWLGLGLEDGENEGMVSMDFPCYPSLPLPGVRRGRGWEVVALCFLLQSYIDGAVFPVGLSHPSAARHLPNQVSASPPRNRFPPPVLHHGIVIHQSAERLLLIMGGKMSGPLLLHCYCP